MVAVYKFITDVFEFASISPVNTQVCRNTFKSCTSFLDEAGRKSRNTKGCFFHFDGTS